MKRPRHIVSVAIEGEPRILDTDLAQRLGFANPIDIRKLVRRHEAALAAMGTVATVATVKRGQQATEYYLNRKQAIYTAANPCFHGYSPVGRRFLKVLTHPGKCHSTASARDCRPARPSPFFKGESLHGRAHFQVWAVYGLCR